MEAPKDLDMSMPDGSEIPVPTEFEQMNQEILIELVGQIDAFLAIVQSGCDKTDVRGLMKFMYINELRRMYRAVIKQMISKEKGDT